MVVLPYEYDIEQCHARLYYSQSQPTYACVQCAYVQNGVPYIQCNSQARAVGASKRAWLASLETRRRGRATFENRFASFPPCVPVRDSENPAGIRNASSGLAVLAQPLLSVVQNSFKSTSKRFSQNCRRSCKGPLGMQSRRGDILSGVRICVSVQCTATRVTAIEGTVITWHVSHSAYMLYDTLLELDETDCRYHVDTRH